MSLFKMLKQNSKLALKGNWGRAISVLVIFSAIVGALSGIQQYSLQFSADSVIASIPASSIEITILSIFTVLTVLLVLPLEMGVCRWFYLLVRGENTSISEIFVFFESIKNYVKSIWLYICILTRAILWSALFFAIPSVVGWFSAGLVNGKYAIAAENPELNAAVGTIGVTLGGMLFVLAAVLFIIWLNRYVLAMFIFFDNIDAQSRMSVSDIIKTSVKYTKGYRLGIFLLYLSFIGWGLLCVFVIPLFFVIPYCITTVTMYARYIIEKNSQETTNITTEIEHDMDIQPDDAPVEEPTTQIPQIPQSDDTLQ